MHDSTDTVGKILILGASSYIGRCLIEKIDPDSVIATYNQSPIKDGVHFDARSMSLTDLPVNPKEISSAIVLLGDAKPDSVASDSVRSHALNVEALTAILEQLRQWNIKPVFTSTEDVYDGQSRNYHESSAPNPITLYGRQKLEIERIIQDLFSDFTIFRLARVYGEIYGDGTLFTDWTDQILGDEKIICAHDQRFSPVFIDDVADGLSAAAAGSISGLYVFGGPISLSRLECLELMIAAFEKKRKVSCEIERCSILDFPTLEPRPLDTTLVSTKLENDLGVKFADPQMISERIVSRRLKKLNAGAMS